MQNSLQRNLFAWPRTRNSACSTARSVVGLKCHQVIWPPSRFRGPLPQTPLFKVEFRFVHCPISKRATRLFYAASSCTPYVCSAGFFDLCLITSNVEAFSKICVSHEICQFSGSCWKTLECVTVRWLQIIIGKRTPTRKPPKDTRTIGISIFYTGVSKRNRSAFLSWHATILR